MDNLVTTPNSGLQRNPIDHRDGSSYYRILTVVSKFPSNFIELYRHGHDSPRKTAPERFAPLCPPVRFFSHLASGIHWPILSQPTPNGPPETKAPLSIISKKFNILQIWSLSRRSLPKRLLQNVCDYLVKAKVSAMVPRSPIHRTY